MGKLNESQPAKVTFVVADYLLMYLRVGGHVFGRTPRPDRPALSRQNTPYSALTEKGTQIKNEPRTVVGTSRRLYKK